MGGCHSDDECKSIKGKTPCNFPVCENNQCKLQLRAVGETCVDPFNDVSECNETKCDSGGNCMPAPQKDGTICGVGACGKVCKTGSCVIATVADYDDKNPCTNDYCDQGKKIVHEEVTNLGVTCEDNDLCTQGDACVKGQCQGSPIVCSDGIDCTIDTCASKTGCEHTPKLDVCSDGNPCTKDACDLSAGCTVVGFEVGSCDDGNPCSENDLCEKGACKGKPSKSACPCDTDGDCVAKATNLCAAKFFCDSGVKVCVPKTNSAVICDTNKDGVCLKTACDVGTGQCVTLPTPGTPACDDNDACTATSFCISGSCLAGSAADCADSNPCTIDACAADVGCFHSSGSGACDDGNPCTANDACQNGGCQGSKIPCDDGKLCTFDSCDPKTGNCQHLANSAPCDDKNACTTDSCDLSADCVHTPDDGATCEDGNVCTTDACKGGKCVSTVKCDCSVDSECDDKNPCTTDTCTGGKCVETPADGNSCSPADKCQKPGSGSCKNSSCIAGNAPVDCSGVADVCNAGICDAATGNCQAIAKPAGTSCDDGNGCSDSDTCAGGKCSGGAPVVCPAVEGKPCVDSVCVSTGSSSHTCSSQPKDSGVVCDDGFFCTVSELCDGKGECVGQPFPCGSESGCMIGKCSESKKTCGLAPADKGSACEDGQFCTIGDSCDGEGTCSSGTPRVCPGGTCLTGTCDEYADVCTTSATPECCVPGDVGGACDDGFSCTIDGCSGDGICTHGKSGVCCDPVVWSASFDSGTWSGMTAQNSTQSSLFGWQLRKGAQSKSVPWAVYYGDPSQNNFNFGASHGSLKTPQMQLPIFPGVAQATIDFQMWFDTENSDIYDKLTLIAHWTDSLGNVQIATLWQKPPNSTVASWFAVDLALPMELSGQTVQFEFYFDTIDAYANAGQGVYLDDIKVQVPCGL